MVQDNDWTYHFQNKADEMIVIAEGNPKKSKELINFLMGLKDEVLNQYASLKEYHVILKANEDGAGT